MNRQEYNGWTNRETWLVNIWFNPETKSDLDCAKETLEEAYDAAPAFLRDFIALEEINWEELAEALDPEEEDEEEEV